jgi:predicted dehydrogenase
MRIGILVAARHPQRAHAFADEHGVERVLDSYQAVLNDPQVEVVYSPLPNFPIASYLWSVDADEIVSI